MVGASGNRLSSSDSPMLGGVVFGTLRVFPVERLHSLFIRHGYDVLRLLLVLGSTVFDTWRTMFVSFFYSGATCRPQLQRRCVMRQRNVALAVAILLSLVGRSAWGQYYYVRDLGTLGGSGSWASGVNASGQVVGYADVSGDNHAFLYSSSGAGTMADLGTLGGSWSSASGTNASGQVVGSSQTSGNLTHAFLYNGTMTDLGTLGGNNSVACAINTDGQVVGYSDTSGTVTHAFLYNGTMTDLGTLGGSASYAYAINASGEVVGQANTGSEFHAFFYNGTMSDLGTLGGSVSGATGLNAGGQIVGFSYLSGNDNLHAFLYSNGTMNDLGVLPDHVRSVAEGINASGQVVGFSETSGSDNDAFLYTSGLMINLNARISSAAGWTLENAVAINDNRQIVGYGYNSSYEEHALRLTPMLPGDANGDGTCNGADLNTVLSHYNQTVPSGYTGWADGDFNGDGTVNGADLNTVLSNYNQSSEYITTGVPEPSTLLLAVIGFCGFLAYEWKKRF